MSILNRLFSSSTVAPIEAVGAVIDNLFTSDEERLTQKSVMQRLAQQPSLAQAEISKVEASHRSVFVAGARPFILWVCGINLLYLTILRDLIAWAISIYDPSIAPPPAVGADITVELVFALLGLGVLRTVEKLKGKSK